jgi:hypothetical protein
MDAGSSPSVKIPCQQRKVFRDGGFMIGIIFSRDRALQLDGVLRSFFLHCQDWEALNLSVLYKTTSALHARQYARLSEAFAPQHVRFISEQSFKRDLLQLLHIPAQDPWHRARYSLAVGLGRWLGYPFHLISLPPGNETVLFMVDDNIFVRSFRLNEISAALEGHANAAGFSLRLGTNTTYCYALDKPQALPEFDPLSDCIVRFRWAGAEGDFGYPLELSSSVYRLEHLLPLLAIIPYANPNELEKQLARRAKRFRRKVPNLLCFRQSVTFCNPVNRVQTVLDNRVGNIPEYSSQGLAEMFEAGYRLDVEAYQDFMPTSCHQEVELAIRKGI